MRSIRRCTEDRACRNPGVVDGAWARSSSMRLMRARAVGLGLGCEGPEADSRVDVLPPRCPEELEEGSDLWNTSMFVPPIFCAEANPDRLRRMTPTETVREYGMRMTVPFALVVLLVCWSQWGTS